MTAAIESLSQREASIFVLHALTAEQIRADLEEQFGPLAVNAAIEVVSAEKGRAIARSITAPETYGELVAEKERYNKAIEEGEIEPPKPIDSDEGSIDPLAVNSYLRDIIHDASEPPTLTPEYYAAASKTNEKPQILAKPEKADWDSSPEKDANLPTRPLTPTEEEIIETAVTEVALHPLRKDEDLTALHFLAEHSADSKGAVSRFILDTAKNRRRTRAFLSNILLRLA